tara:strand:+ start:107689 stop:108831 length:1143 start_codon:yes stop_codon:yes gene_type:complete
LKKFGFILFCIVTLKSGAQSSALAIADSLYSIGDYTKAINQYAKVGTPSANLQIARTYNVVRNYDKAIVQYKTLIERNPNAQLVRFELGKIYAKTRKSEKAQQLFETLVSEYPNNPEYFYYLGSAYANLDSIPKSVQLFKSAIARDSTHLRSIYEVAKYYVSEQERDSVVKYADKGLNFYENDVSLINLKALALYNNDEFKAAIPLFEKMVALGETTKFYIFERLGNAYFKTEDLDNAIGNYKKSLFLDSENARVLFSLGNTFWKQQKLDSATVYIQQSIDVQLVVLDQEYQALGRLASEQKDYKIALKYYKLAHEEDPENVIYYYQVCVIADQYYKDPKVKLKYYEQLLEKYSNQNNYFTNFTERRISELKEEIHFATD